MDIIWAKTALTSLQKISYYIYEDSAQNAYNIVNEIVSKIDELKNHPERYKVDTDKINNNGNYRVFEHKKIRISYKLLANKIEIVRIKHTSQMRRKY